MRKATKSILISVGIILVLVVLVIVFISPITKYMVEKYDVEYTGRTISMDRAYVNPFTGYLHFRNLRINEYNSDSLFLSVKGFSANFNVIKLFSGKYEISALTLDEPYGSMIQSRDQSNINDLIERFSAKEPKDTTAAPVQFVIEKFEILDGELHYLEQVIPVDYFIKEFNLTTRGIRWDSDTITGEFEFVSGPASGTIKGNYALNTESNRYRVAVKINGFDLNLIEQYLKDLTNYGTMSAILDADIRASGSMVKSEDITMEGMIDIRDFRFGKNAKEDYASFDRLRLTIDEISPMKYIFHGDSVLLERPYFKYEKYDYLDNLQTMFGKDGANIDAAMADSAKFNLILEIGEFIKDISRYFFRSHYQINSLDIADADFVYNDYSISEKFSMALSPLDVVADSIDKNHPTVNIRMRSGIKPYGSLNAGISINPKDSSDWDLTYSAEKIPLTMFNPYSISFTSYPFDRGTIELKGDWTVRDGNINSTNHLLVIDPRVIDRLRNKEIKFIPMKIVMALVRESANVIDYEIPIRGNLKDPKFKIGDIVFDAIENIFVKPVRTPYRAEVKQLEMEIEKSLTLKWPMRHSTLLPPQERFAEKMAKFLADNPEASISVEPLQYEEKEKEYILFYEAKKKYYLAEFNKELSSFNEEDSAYVEKMSIKDSAFVDYLHKNIKDHLKFTIQEKCSQLVEPSIVNDRYKQLNQKRKDVFLEFFRKENVEKQVHIHQGKDMVPFNGFTLYRINYKGDFPDQVLTAYERMEKLNKKRPRRKFSKEREENLPSNVLNTNEVKN